MNPIRLSCLCVLAALLSIADGLFFTNTAAAGTGAITLTIPTLTASSATAAAALGGLGALGAGTLP